MDASLQPPLVTYEDRLVADAEWALMDSSRHFREESEVFRTLKRITERLGELHVPYVLVGGLALFKHGFRRYTEDVDLLVTASGLKQIHDNLDGLGYLPPYAGSKHLRDAETGVRVEFLTTGDYPGDGKPKPISFPNPADVSVDIGGVSVLALPALVDLKLASGLSNAGRLKDLGDVQELIRGLDLPRDFGHQIHESVREDFYRLWDGVEFERRRIESNN